MTAKAATGHLQIERPLLKEKTQSTSYIPPRRTPNPVEREHSDDHSSISEEQSLFIIRHGDRYDYENPEVCLLKFSIERHLLQQLPHTPFLYLLKRAT